MREPLGAEHLDGVLDAALSLDGADEVEARAVHVWGGVARFAGSAIHQHVTSDDTSVSVRVATGGRVGVASTNDATSTGAAAAAARALAAAQLSQSDPRYPGLAGPVTVPEVGRRFDQATATASPARRSEAAASLLAALRAGQQGAGAVSTNASEVAFATTAGARLHALSTRASAHAVVTGDGATGHAEDAATALSQIDATDLGARAASTAAAAVHPLNVVPGPCDVVLLPSAVATLVEYLGGAFSAKAVAEGRSPCSDRCGEAFASPLIDLCDDALGEGAFGILFDGEGSPLVRVELLTAGRAVGVVHDRASAAAADTTSTGHGLPAPNPCGPAPSHLVLAAGTSSLDELIAGVDQGLLITRFWYTRPVNPKQTLVTGMTRDGTFAIEGGRRVGPVRNLRFNQSILEAWVPIEVSVHDELSRSSPPGGQPVMPSTPTPTLVHLHLGLGPLTPR